MKRRLLLFVLKDEDGVFHEIRGDFLCFPCIVVPQYHSAAQALYDVFHRSRIFLSGYFPTPIVAESYVDEYGETKEFEFAGEKVIAEYYVITNHIRYFHNVFDRTRLVPDVFVKFFEQHVRTRHHAHAA